MKKFTYCGMGLNLKFLSVVGSTLQGVNTNDSDLDLKGVFTWDNDLYFNLNQLQNSLEKTNTNKDEWNNLLKQLNQEFDLNLTENDDLVLYEAKTFFELSFKNDSNMFDMLYANENFVLYQTKTFKQVKENKDKFVDLFQASKRYQGMSATHLKQAEQNKGNVNKNYSKALQMLLSLDYLLKNKKHTCSLDLETRNYLKEVRNGNFDLENFLFRYKTLKENFASFEQSLDKNYNPRETYLKDFNNLLVSLYKEF